MNIKKLWKLKKIVQRVALYKQGSSYTFSGAKLAIFLVLLVVTMILIRGHVEMENEIVPTRPRSDLSKISYPECNWCRHFYLKNRSREPTRQQKLLKNQNKDNSGLIQNVRQIRLKSRWHHKTKQKERRPWWRSRRGSRWWWRWRQVQQKPPRWKGSGRKPWRRR